MLDTSGKVVANYWLDHVFTPEAGAAHREGAIHIHDLDMLAGYCAGWSLRALLEEGFDGVAGAVSSGPPKHLTSALGQMVNFLGTLQNEWTGAQSFSSFGTYLAPFVRLDGLTYDQVEQAIQESVFNLNVPSRWGTQTPFTNLTIDWSCPPELRDQIPFIGDEPVDFTYGDLHAEMDLLNRAFIEVMGRGDASGRGSTFPIPTYNTTADFDWDHPDSRRPFDMTALSSPWGRGCLRPRRRTVAKLADDDLYPCTQRWLPGLDNHFSTLGINGVNEMVRNLTRDADDITTAHGHAMAADLLDHIRTRLVAFRESTGHMFNLEATPAEGATYRFAREDRRRHPGILQAGTDDEPYYTNSSQLTVGHTDDPFRAQAEQEELQSKYTGGMLHLYMGEAIDSGEACATLVRRSLENFRLPYVTVTPTFSVCAAHGYHSGELEACPTCGGEVEMWTRVMGYFRPVSSFNTGKKGEHHERLPFAQRHVA